MDFYNQIANSYDEMTNLDSRLEGIRSFIEAIKTRYEPHSAIDVACGTGSHAVVMSQMGIHAVGADISTAMLQKAQAFARQAGVSVQWINCPMQELSQQINEKFDIVLCLGNSLPHILTQEDIDKTISGFAKALQPGGVLLIQLLNYRKILQQKERIVAITRKGNNEYIRFYDFLPKLVQFNLLKIDSHSKQLKHTFTSTPLFPYTTDILREVLQRHQFSTINTYSDLSYNSFDEDNSSNLVIEAHL